MYVKIRRALPGDFEKLKDILVQNNMLDYPKVDGREAMQRVCDFMGKYFLVAETSGEVVGMIRACYDGSRALIHQMVVDKKYQRQGIGKKLMCRVASALKEDGALSVSVTSTENSKTYYKGLGFEDLPITVMVAFDVDKLLEKIK